MLQVIGLWWEAAAGGGGSPDTTPPIGVITSPVNNSSVSGTIHIVGLFTDDVGVTDGRLEIDGLAQSYSGQSGGSFDIVVDTRTLPDGARTFRIDAVDAAGNHGYSQTITLHVSNAAAGSSGGQQGILAGAAGGIAYAPPRREVKVIEESPPKKKKASAPPAKTAPDPDPAPAPPRKSSLLAMKSGEK